MARLQALHDKYHGEPLVLPCFERNPNDCHRSWAARWPNRQGFDVHEVRTPPTLIDSH